MKNENRNGRFTFFRTHPSHNVFGSNPIVFRHQWADQYNPIFGIELISAIDPLSAAHARVGLPRMFKGCAHF